MPEIAFKRHTDQIFTEAKISGLESLIEAGRRVREFYKKSDPSIKDTTVIDFAVSYGINGVLHRIMESGQPFTATQVLSVTIMSYRSLPQVFGNKN